MLIRYPGTKDKLVAGIISRFPDTMRLRLLSHVVKWEYREPFFGAGAIGFRILHELPSDSKVWINDLDFGIYALWKSVRDDPDGLFSLIDSFVPSADLFYQFKNEDGRDGLPLTMAGFRKLALHRMSYSGLGYMSGGPLGGKNQKSAKYPVDCRWVPQKIKMDIARLNKLMRRFKNLKISNVDFSSVLDTAKENCFIYADPPYYEKGPELYKHSMSEADHVRLSGVLKNTPARWALSYDDHPDIRSMYSWAQIEAVNVTYTASVQRGGARPKNKEIVITPREES